MLFKKFNKFELFLAIVTSILIFSFYFIFNFNYLTKFIDEKFDSNTYRNHIYNYLCNKDLKRDLTFNYRYNIFNPHHIAFDWTGLAMYQLLTPDKKDYSPESLMTILQLRNLLISSIGLSLIFFLFYKISKKYILSLLIIILIGFSCAYWIYSQINDTPIIHSVFVALLFFATIYFPKSKNKYIYSLFLGIFHAVTVMFHQSNLIFIFVISFIILLANNIPLRNKKNDLYDEEIDFKIKKNIEIQNSKLFKFYNIRYFLIYLFTLLFIILSIYYYVGIIFIGLTLDSKSALTVDNIKDSTYFFNWLILYSRIDYWGRGYEGGTLLKLSKGIMNYFFEPDMYYKGELIKLNYENIFSPVSILPNFIIIFMFFIGLFSILFSIPLLKRYKYIFVSIMIFVISYAVFACWWEPDYREFWVAPMFSFWILSFFVLNYIFEKSVIIKPVPHFFIYTFLFIFCFLLFYTNFTGFLYSKSGKQFQSFDIMSEKYEKLIIKKEKSNNSN